MRFVPFLLFTAILFSTTPAQALRMNNGDLSLRPEPPPVPKTWGIAIGGDARTALQDLALQGLEPSYSRAIGSDGKAHIHVFEGVPNELAVDSGSTTALFYNDKLIRLDIRYRPTYAGFLTLRSQVLESNHQFHVTLSQTAMENMLKTRLAHMSRKEYGRHAESLIADSMRQGKTFYHYLFNGDRGRLDGGLTYAMKTLVDGEEEPILQLYCNDQRGMTAYREYRKSLHSSTQ